MKRIAEGLADYVIQKGMVKEEDRELYEYGFTMIAVLLACYDILNK